MREPREDTISVQQLQTQIELLKRQLQDAQRLSALGELVGTTTHEFNNMLMTVINYAKIGARNHDQPTRDKAFKRILEAGERAAAVTQTILAMAQIAAPSSNQRIWKNSSEMRWCYLNEK